MSVPKQYPAWVFSADTVRLQRELIAGGYLSEFNADGKANDDGWFGPATHAALQQRELELAEMPAPAKPWWESRRGKGAAKLAIGAVVGGLGLVWSGAPDMDAGQAVEVIYAAGPQIDAALAIARDLLETLGLLLAALGLGQSAVGAWAAKGPIDAGLVARVAGRDVRVPERLHLPSDAGRSAGGGSPRNRGPFNDGH